MARLMESRRYPDINAACIVTIAIAESHAVRLLYDSSDEARPVSVQTAIRKSCVLLVSR